MKIQVKIKKIEILFLCMMLSIQNPRPKLKAKLSNCEQTKYLK